MRYLTQVLIAIDQLLNALIGGYSDETLSSNAYRMEREGPTLGLTSAQLDQLFVSAAAL